jgi:Domain of unknown function (DUF4281)
MTPDMMFSTASTAALVAWVLLVCLPRRAWLLALLRHGLIGALSLAYAALVAVHFFQVPGGGFDSIAQVRALFADDSMLVAGWIHYLAFDLFVGIWIAEHSDRLGISRTLQAPILVLTFLFGPLGLLVHLVLRAAAMRPATKVPA